MIIFLIPTSPNEYRDCAVPSANGMRCPVLGEQVFIDGGLYIVAQVTHHIERGIIAQAKVALRSFP